jgi:predicted TIM-barrel fold metal-dependent hydrolase
MKIDAFCHIMPRAYHERFFALAENAQTGDLRERVSLLPTLVDLDERFRQMDEFGGYRQLINMAAPPVWDMGSPQDSRDMARLGNECLAELVADHPDRFVGFCAGVPLDDPDAAVEEYLYARNELGAQGVQIYTDVHGRALDAPEFDPFYEAVADSGGLLQVHPCRSSAWPDYPTETRSRYEIWWAFGWEYDMSAFMARIVFSGVLERFPELKLLIHHAGGMVPHFAGRVGPGWDQLGMRTPESRKEDVEGYPLTKRPLDYFKLMYADTALFGAKHALQCSIEFYGVDHIVFGSDSPYGPPTHGGYLMPTIENIDELDLTGEERAAIYHGNITKLLGLPVPARAG